MQTKSNFILSRLPRLTFLGKRKTKKKSVAFTFLRPMFFTSDAATLEEKVTLKRKFAFTPVILAVTMNAALVLSRYVFSLSARLFFPSSYRLPISYFRLRC